MIHVECLKIIERYVLKKSPQMSSIQDVRPAFLIARTFGLAPYSITGSSVTLSRKAILYTVPWMLFYLYALYNRLHIYFTDGGKSKFRILSVIRTILAVAALVVDAVILIAKDKSLQAALDNVKKYDLAVKYDVAINAKALRIHSWTIFGFMNVYFLVIGWVTYFDETQEPLMAAIIYVYLYLPMSIAVMKFVTLITSIFLRFRHLNGTLFPGFLSIVMEVDSEMKRLHLRDVCWLHSCLCTAAEHVNSLYSFQLLLWFTNFTFNTITRINAFMDTEEALDVIKVLRDGALIFVFVMLVTVLAGVCHFTSNQANKVGGIVFSPSSRYFHVRLEQDREDQFFIGQYFALHSLHFTAACGFFRINLPLLLKIAGAMTTYLVILKSPTSS